ncbi:geranylgeranyl diphosphate reductase [Afifella sp. IM 167]|uniref:geranylgeranyl diphosphate reductase n=1 Tax=Afifella sp. IM 167 TaxID=2033586 RepID=UPI001CCC3EE0|nr:geranylgeranyl diphosphate reductase [Afifella sp. IM 167]MBZ8132230.1 geranylgeranyl diphosphate reductase [Afifella sp. IM 167]
MSNRTYDVAVVGGGPAGATAATDLARKGLSVLLLDRQGRIKPCGGAIPPRLLRDFDIPRSMLVAEVTSAEIVSPSDRRVDMPIENGFVGMVDREHFDEWLRERAAEAGAERRAGTFERFDRDTDGTARIHYRPKGGAREALETVRARAVIGADGANSAVAREAVPRAGKVPYVFAYHEIVRSPQEGAARFDPKRCDVYYDGRMSPDFYSWIFPHGETTSIGTGSAHKGFSLKDAVGELRQISGLDGTETIRKEGAPIPLKPRRKWDNDRDVVLAGDAAGVVAPASGEGIYYAMTCGRMAGEAVEAFLATGDARALAGARKAFMKEHGKVFWALGIMQHFWYSSDRRRERFVSMCADPDVQRITWEAYMNKRLVKARPGAHLRIFLKDMAHLLGLVSPGHVGRS